MRSQKTLNPSRVLLAPDSFKETLTNIGVVEAMAVACQQIWPGCALDCCPVADGGEGTLEALQAPWALSGRSSHVVSPGTREPRLAAQWALGGPDRERGVVELAEAAGLALVPPEERDPEALSTHGVGMLMGEAAANNVRELIVAVGGSATVDGGVGALGALGVIFRDNEGEAIPTPISGGQLGAICSIEVPDSVRRVWDQIKLRIAADVENPLLGAFGAAREFGPQKGATPEAVERLEKGMANFARVAGKDPEASGSGAAGGVPFGLTAVLGGSIERGIDMVLDAIDFDARCRKADLVLTGEGALDAQSRMGKAAVAVAQRAQTLDVPVIAVVGHREDDFGNDLPFHRIVALTDHFGEEVAKNDPSKAILTSMEAALG